MREPMRAYCIFDDFTPEAAALIRGAGIELTEHPLGVPRPAGDELGRLLKEYDCLILGTSQKLTPELFDGIDSPKIIATASVGTDHIQVPEDKKHLITVLRAPRANARSVAEYTVTAALSCVKRMQEGAALYAEGKDNKKLSAKPEDLWGKTMGVVGAGNISVMIMEYAAMLGMRVLYWTAHPEKHTLDSRFVYRPLEELAAEADVISVNLPNNAGTRGLISRELVARMKSRCVFISVSRLETVDLAALVERAEAEQSFYVNADIDVNEAVIALTKGRPHVCITPHIAGGTVESRKRAFTDVAEELAALVRQG